MPEQHVESVLNELKKFETHITNIGDAIVAKGVQSRRKLYNFAEEIKKIKGFPFSDTMFVAISNAIGVGLTDEEVTRGIAEFTTNNVQIDFMNTSIPVNKYKNNKTIKQIHAYFQVNTIGDYAFNGSNLRKLTAHLVKKIGPMTFENCSELEELNLGGYEYKPGNFFSLRNCQKMKKLIVGDNSNIDSGAYNQKIAVTNKNIEIYTYSGKKYNKSTYSFE